MSSEPFELTATEAAIAIKKGKLNPVDLALSCIERFELCEDQVKAYAYFDKKFME